MKTNYSNLFSGIYTLSKCRQDLYRILTVSLIMFLPCDMVGNSMAQEGKSSTLVQYESLYKQDYEEFLRMKTQLKGSKEGSEAYKELTKDLSYMTERLDEIESKIADLGGDVNALKNAVSTAGRLKRPNEIKVPVEGSVEVFLDGSEEQIDLPKDWYPWPINEWPVDSRAMRELDLFKAVRNLRDSPTDWARKLGRELVGRGNRQVLIQDVIKAYFSQLTNLQWEDFANKHPTHAFDMKRFTDFMTEDEEFKASLVSDVAELHRKQVFSKRVSWNWLDVDLNIGRIQPRYEKAQRELRKYLLFVDDEWSQNESSNWNTQIKFHGKTIVESERQMIWLLGYNEIVWVKKDKKTKLIAKIQKEKLAKNNIDPLLKNYFDSYVIHKYLKVQKAFAEVIPFSLNYNNVFSISDTFKNIEDKELIANMPDLYQPELDNKKSILINLIRKLNKTDFNEYIMLEGLKRLKSLQIFEPHTLDGNDDFYTTLLAGKSAQDLGFSFAPLMSSAVYEEFLSGKELEVYKEEAKKRAPDTKSRQ